MNLTDLLDKIKQHPDIEKTGMILCHNGIVRNSSRNGEKVTGLTVTVDHHRLNTLIHHFKQQPGIIEILVEINENKTLCVGDDVMFLVVAGDIRDHVVPVLQDLLNAIKKDVTRKTEFFKPSS